MMRTTLTLDEDVAVLLRCVQETRRVGQRAVVNQALRLGLEQLVTAPKPDSTPYRTRVASGGRCLLPNLDNAAEVLAWAEGEDRL